MWIYHPKATQEELKTNGIGKLTATSAIVHEEINGEYSMTVAIPPDSPHFDAFTGGAVIKAPTPRGEDYFRLSKPTATLEGGKEAFCWHISYDLSHDMILDRYWTGKTGAESWPDILQAGISERRFTGTSDIGLVNNMRIVRSNVLSALIGEQDNSFVNRWGGEIERNGFTVNMPHRTGRDNGVTIRYRKNLTGLVIEEEYDGIVNRVIPTGLTENDVSVLLTEIYIDSDRINETPVPHVMEAHYSDVKVGAADENDNIIYPDINSVYAELRKRVADMYAQGADRPRISATVEFIDLAATEEYKNYAQLETVQLGDTVRCKYEPYDVDLVQRVVAYDYDALAKRYISITLGEKAATLSDSLWAQDLDLSALRNEMDDTLKQGVPYNNVWINHEDGFVCEAVVNGHTIRVKMNAVDAFQIIFDGSVIGGFEIINGQAAMVSTMIKMPTGNAYGKIGTVDNLNGLILYDEMGARICAVTGDSTYLLIHDGRRSRIQIDDRGIMLLGPSGETLYHGYTVSGSMRSTMYCPSNSSSQIGVDATGPYIQRPGQNRVYL